MPRDKGEKLHFEDAAVWIERARKDYAAFKLLTRFSLYKALVKLNRKLYKHTSSSDSALSVYLLQQCVEKTIKALAIASGEYKSEQIKRNFGHDSQKLLLDFWSKLQEIMYEPEHSPTLPSIIRLADISSEEVLVVLQFIERLHDQALSIISKLVFKPGDILELSYRGSADGLRDWFTYVSGGRPAVPEEGNLTDVTFKAFLELRDVSGRAGNSSAAGKSKNILVRQFLGEWSLISLLILAAITFPHEDTSRYPNPFGRGCENYTDDSGIAKHINYLGYVFGMTLSYIDCVLEMVSQFFSTTKYTE